MTSLDSLTDRHPLASSHERDHEHAWSTRSRHATSEGWVIYVRCDACGAWRVDAGRDALLPPVAASTVVARPGQE